MGVAGRTRRGFVPTLAIVALVGLVVRVTYVLLNRERILKSDGWHYQVASLSLSDGHGFVNPLAAQMLGKEVQDAVHPPAWTSVLAVSNLLGGRSPLTHQLLACVIGTAAVVVTGLAGRRAFGPRVGLIAAAITAVYANVWLYERELFAEPLALLGVATVIYLTYLFRADPRLRWAVALGGAVAVLALTRSELILLAPIVVAPVILGRREATWKLRFGWLAAAGAACALVIAPWSIYNATRFEKPVPLSAGLGGAMETGNCPPTFEDSKGLLGWYEFGCLFFVPNISPEPSVADVQYRDAAAAFMKSHKSELPKVVAARIGRAFNLFRPNQQIELEAERGTDTSVLRLGMWMYWALLPFAVAGVVLARRRHVPLYPLLAYPAIVVVAVAMTIGSVRYRAPAEIPFVLLAAVTLDLLYSKWQERRRGPRVEAMPVDVPEEMSVVS